VTSPSTPPSHVANSIASTPLIGNYQLPSHDFLQHPDPNLKPTCFSPSSTWFENERNTHQQHELRFSTPDDWRLRAIAGASEAFSPHATVEQGQIG